MPIANGFLLPTEIPDEKFFDLSVGLCRSCAMVQLTNVLNRDQLFHDSYAFFSSTSEGMKRHFKEMAASLTARYLENSEPLVVEIGSNDGIFLSNFIGTNVRVLGVEPSANVAAVAVSKGVRTVSKFFDEQLASKVVNEDGKADLIVGANVLCHIPYLNSVFAGVRTLLKTQGALVFEDPYVGDIIKKTSYDQIYDEHAFYFSILAVSAVCSRHDLEVFDVEPQTVHGGSMRYHIGIRGARPVSIAVSALMEQERSAGLDRLETFETFRKNVENSRTELLSILQKLKAEGARISGYGATSKSTTVLNYCGIGTNYIEFICDTTPGKQGRLTPGSHIPVVPYGAFAEKYPEYAVLFAWNHSNEILAKEVNFKNAGGRFITYVPAVGILK